MKHNPDLYLDLNFAERDMLERMSQKDLNINSLQDISKRNLSMTASNKLFRKIRKLKSSEYIRELPVITKERYEQQLSWLDRHIVCGFHSGFPPCCVKFFVGTWIWAIHDYECSLYQKHFDKILKLNPGYVACPTCVRKKKFVKVKRCPKGSHPDE